MTVKALLDAYREVARKHDLPPMEGGTTTVVSCATLAPGPTSAADSDAWRFVSALAPRQGWMQFQSRVVAFKNGEIPTPAPDWGFLLAAEAVLPDGRATVIGPDGRGTLQAVVLAHSAVRAETDTVTNATPAIIDRVRHRATGSIPDAHRGVNYIRYWRADPERGLVPVVAAFAGFAPPEG